VHGHHGGHGGVDAGCFVLWYSNICSSKVAVVGTWEADDPTYSRPIAAPLEKCADLLGVDLTAIQHAASDVEPYIRVDGTKVWSLMQLERRLRPEAYGRVRGGYISRRRRPPLNCKASTALPEQEGGEAIERTGV